MTDEKTATSEDVVKSSSLPALWIFLIPILSLLFFYHAQKTYDDEWREEMLVVLERESEIPADEKEEIILRIQEFTPSDHIASEGGEGFSISSMLTNDTAFDYTFFKWMIWLSWFAILSILAVVILAGITVKLSAKSQKAQYLSLSFGFTLLRVLASVQVLLQGLMLVSLSFWVTVLWTESYYPKIIIIVGIFAAIAAFGIIAAIFRKIDNKIVLEGEAIDRDKAPWLWEKLDTLCNDIGTSTPTNVIAGIDDSFFVTESDIHIGKRVHSGKSLFFSLSMLKQMSEDEASAVMSHEMAHFSGNDTHYTQKIAPLLSRFDMYLIALYEGVMSLPIFYFMVAFRNLFQLSIGQVSREREYRADRIAADNTSPMVISTALIKLSAYSAYRNKIEMELFEKEEALEEANIQDQIADGYAGFMNELSIKDVDDSKTAHPFDSHPPIKERCDSLDVSLEMAMDQVSTESSSSRWYGSIEGGDELEAELWKQYESQFSGAHEQSLIYRYLPSNEEEAQYLAKHFPEVVYEAKKSKGPLKLDYEKITDDSLDEPVYFKDVADVIFQDSSFGTKLVFRMNSGGKKRKVSLGGYTKKQNEILNVFNEYYGRYLTAQEYAKVKAYREKMDAEDNE